VTKLRKVSTTFFRNKTCVLPTTKISCFRRAWVLWPKFQHSVVLIQRWCSVMTWYRSLIQCMITAASSYSSKAVQISKHSVVRHSFLKSSEHHIPMASILENAHKIQLQTHLCSVWIRQESSQQPESKTCKALLTSRLSQRVNSIHNQHALDTPIVFSPALRPTRLTSQYSEDDVTILRAQAIVGCGQTPIALCARTSRPEADRNKAAKIQRKNSSELTQSRNLPYSTQWRLQVHRSLEAWIC